MQINESADIFSTSKMGIGKLSLFLINLLFVSIIFISTVKNCYASPTVGLIEEINIQKLVNGFDKNIIKQNNVVYDPYRNKIYVSGGLTEPIFAVINPQTDTIEDLFDMRAPGGIMALSDNGKLYIVNTHRRICTRYDPDAKRAYILQDQRECQQALDHPKYGINRPKFLTGGYVLTSVNTWDERRYHGYAPTSTQDLNGLYNKIKLIYNRAERAEIIHGPDAMFFDVDEKDGKIYASNTGDSSISVFDLRKFVGGNGGKDSCWIKDIHLGVAIDGMLLDPAGNIYIRNRLGGSTIYQYNQTTKRVSLFADNENNLSRKQAIFNSSNWNGGGISMWPTGFALSQDGREMYVFSHYNASIDVINTATRKFLAKLVFPVPWKPRTDSLSEITMDYANNRMFGVWPELGLIGVADLTKRSVVTMIDLYQFGFDRNRALNRGLGLVKLAYNSKLQKLYIFLTDERKLIMLDGKTFRREKGAVITSPLDSFNLQFNSVLLSNDVKGEIYLGNQTFDALQLTPKFSLDSPSQIIVGFNNADNSIYTDQMSQDRSTGLFGNTLKKFVGGSATKQLSTGHGAVISAKYYFDFPKNTVYAYFMAEGKIRKFDLLTMQN